MGRDHYAAAGLPNERMIEKVDWMATSERVWDEPQKVEVPSIRLGKAFRSCIVAQCNRNLAWVVHF